MKRSLAIRLAVVAALGTALVLLLRGMDLSALFRALATADARLILAAMFVNFVLNSLGRSARFALLARAIPTAHGKQPGFFRLARLLLATRALNFLLPARAGETLRALRLRKPHGYPIESTLAVLLVETALETLALCVPVAALSALALAGLGGVIPPALRPPVAALGAVGGAAALALLLAPAFARLLPRRSSRGPVPAAGAGLWARARARVRGMRRGLEGALSCFVGRGSRATLPKALAWTWFADLMDVLSLALCLRAVGIDLGEYAAVKCFVLYAGINLAIALPAMPGHLGSLEAGAVAVLSAMGVEPYRALAFALVYHAIQFVPILAAGLVALHYELGPGGVDFAIGGRKKSPIEERSGP